MDSSPTIAIAEQAVAETPESRLQRLAPVVRSLTGKVKTLTAISAGSAVVLWWIWFDPQLWVNGVDGQRAVLAVVVLLALLIPAGAAFIGYRTLQDILDVPAKLNGALAETTAQARGAIASRDVQKRSRLLGFFKAIWAARGLVLESKGAMGKALVAVRVARLASLPFVLALVAAFALNFVVIAVAALAVGLSVLF